MDRNVMEINVNEEGEKDWRTYGWMEKRVT